MNTPLPTNKAGGITTLEEKSLGYTQKAGQSKVVDVLKYGERLSVPGLNLLSTPGNDTVATSALAGAGATWCCQHRSQYGRPLRQFCTDRESELAAKKPHWIDFDAGRLIHGMSMDAMLTEFLIVAFANDKKTWNEINEFRELAIFKSGVIL